MDVAEETIVVAMVLEKSMVILEMEVVSLMSTINLMTKNGIQFQTKNNKYNKIPCSVCTKFLAKIKQHTISSLNNEDDNCNELIYKIIIGVQNIR